MMFREVYHNANDDIPVNKDLLNAILSEKTKKHKYLYPRFTAAAAILLISAAVLAYPKIANKPTDNITPQVTLAPVVTVAPAAAPKNTAISTEPAPGPENNIENNSHAETAAPQKSETEDKKTHAPAQKSEKRESAHSSKSMPTHTPQAASGSVQKQETPQNAAAAENEQENQSDTTALSAPTPEVKGVNSDPVNRDSLVTESWSEDRYFEYLGRKINPTVPAGLLKVSSETKNMTLCAETGTPYYDMWVLKYASEDGTKKITLRISKSKSNCADAPKSELHKEISAPDAFFTIDAQGLSQEEFDTFCNSI